MVVGKENNKSDTVIVDITNNNKSNNVATKKDYKPTKNSDKNNVPTSSTNKQTDPQHKKKQKNDTRAENRKLRSTH